MAMTIGQLGTAVAIALVLSMAFAWAVALHTGRSGWIDTVWTFATGGAGVAAALVPLSDALPGSYWHADSATARQALVAALAAAWSLRLGIHIALRTARGGDDPRYARLRDDWGAAFRVRLFWFLQLQALAAFALAVSFFAAARNPAPELRLGDVLGIIVFAIAIAGEALADGQLARFRSTHIADRSSSGRVCDVGLWAHSRHPNYYFEWLGWTAYALIAIDTGGDYPAGWLALGGPVLMYWLLVHVSGIPPLEAHMLRSRGEAFRAYQARVNAFWPGPARRVSARVRIS